MNYRNIAVIGAGGIGSWLAEFLYKAKQGKQIPLTTQVTLMDFDSVEPKNLQYQNFTFNDLTRMKAEVLANRFYFRHQVQKVQTAEDLAGFDLIILAVDNSLVRKLVFETCEASGVQWIDLRCNERNIGYYIKSKKNTLAEMLKTIGNTDEKGSCQRPVDIEKNTIHYSCIVIAAYGVQILLNLMREEQVVDSMIKRI
jgi:hypothetical protein